MCMPNIQITSIFVDPNDTNLLLPIELTRNPPDGITAGPMSDDNMLEWEALISGPPGTPYEGGLFPAKLSFPKDYPHSPPTMRFSCDLFHPNGNNETLYLSHYRDGLF